MNARRNASIFSALAVLVAFAGSLDGCNSTKGTDSQTNWLCKADPDCTEHGPDLVCVSGRCVPSSTVNPDGAIVMGSDGGSGGSTSADAGSAGLSALAKTALFHVSLGRADTGRFSGSSSARVINFLPPRCLRTELGNCAVVDCRVDRPDSGLFGLTGVSAGVVTISGGGGGDVVLEPDRFGVYTTKSPVGWQAGDALRLSAAGDVVPAFSDTVSLLAPLVLVSPDPASTRATNFRRDAGLLITWQSTDETVTAGVTFVGPGGGTWDQIEGYCDSPGTAGSATLPSELFRDFPPGAATLFAGHSQVKTSQAGSHPLRLITNHGAAGISVQLL